MLKNIKNKESATLIELIIVILLVAVIGASIAGTVIFFIQMFVFSPRQLDVQKIANELIFTMIEGNKDIRGMRYARKVINGTSATQFLYTYGYPTASDQLSVRLRWNASDKHIYRSTSTNGGATWSSESLVPYYISPAITIDGKDTPSVIFSYKKANDADWIFGTDPYAFIRRVVISINVKSGTGVFGALEGSFNTTASVEIKGF
ncbi:MAG: hypothetical protein FJZ10_04270 [Candidatus Omnitrophica bacterium]|nr:hypothetical protein [Candidatus Omnitrophota bacterium]